MTADPVHRNCYTRKAGVSMESHKVDVKMNSLPLRALRSRDQPTNQPSFLPSFLPTVSKTSYIPIHNTTPPSQKKKFAASMNGSAQIRTEDLCTLGNSFNTCKLDRRVDYLRYRAMKALRGADSRDKSSGTGVGEPDGESKRPQHGGTHRNTPPHSSTE